MKQATVTLGKSEFEIAMPIGALDDLKSRGVDVLAEAMKGEEFIADYGVVRALVDVAGAWGADPERGRPGKGKAISFEMVYEGAGIVRAAEIAAQALALAFAGGESDENPTKAGGD